MRLGERWNSLSETRWSQLNDLCTFSNSSLKTSISNAKGSWIHEIRKFSLFQRLRKVRFRTTQLIKQRKQKVKRQFLQKKWWSLCILLRWVRTITTLHKSWFGQNTDQTLLQIIAKQKDRLKNVSSLDPRKVLQTTSLAFLWSKIKITDIEISQIENWVIKDDIETIKKGGI